jgi:hypothetical protein
MTVSEKDTNHQQVQTNASSARLDVELQEILRSAPFSSSRQCQNLLRYLVEKSGQGGEESLKERVIGVEVFGRSPDYNTGDDPIVRARVGEVRKRLAQYYLSEESSHAKIKIAIPSGSYRAFFEFLREEAPVDKIQPSGLTQNPFQKEAAAQISPASPIPIPKRPNALTATRVWVAGALFTCLLLFLAFVIRRGGSQNTLDQFWAPVLQSSKPVLIYTGTNAVYMPTSSFASKREHRQEHEQSDGMMLFLSPLAPGETLTSADLYPINYEFTTVGDMSVNVRLASLLTSQHHSFDVRAGENISIGDLRESPSVLVGGYNNFLTLKLSHNLPFALDGSEDGRQPIQESGGTRKGWSPRLDANRANGEDYAIVARLLNSETGNPVIIIAGVTSFGTRAAGQFVTNAEGLKALTTTAPKDWANKNLELVVRTVVLKSDPGATTIVAARYW